MLSVSVLACRGTLIIMGLLRNLPRGSYPTPFLGYLVPWLGSVILKSRRPKKGVGCEPLGRLYGVKSRVFTKTLRPRAPE